MLSAKDRINTKEDLKEWLDYELKQYGDTYPYLPDFLMLNEEQILRFHQKILRKCEYYYNNHSKIKYLFHLLLLRNIQNKYGMHIPINCCGTGLRLMHVGYILMNRHATVGRDCVFHVNTMLVAGGTNDLTPTLENNVIMAINSSVVGGVHIASNVVIAAHSLVIKDVQEENITVGGIPAKKISLNGVDAWRKRPKTIFE